MDSSGVGGKAVAASQLEYSVGHDKLAPADEAVVATVAKDGEMESN